MVMVTLKKVLILVLVLGDCSLWDCGGAGGLGSGDSWECGRRRLVAGVAVWSFDSVVLHVLP